MIFKEAFELMKQGAKVKLPGWNGYWCWDNDKQTIMIHCRPKDSDKGQGEVLDIRETQRVEYTFMHTQRDDWMIADEKNCGALGGRSTFGFGDAIRYLKRGLKVARKGWNGKGIYLEMYSPEVNLETIAEAVHNAWWEEKKKQGVTDHPDMIPYSELSEEVKEYDRVTARTTIEAFNYMTHSFIYINTTGLQTENPYAPKNKVPWIPSQTDMLAEDWVFAE